MTLFKEINRPKHVTQNHVQYYGLYLTKWEPHTNELGDYFLRNVYINKMGIKWQHFITAEDMIVYKLQGGS